MLVAADGTVQGVETDAAEVATTRAWRAGSGRVWPLDWTVRLGDLELAITPVMDDQEHGFAMPLWSGLVRAEGRRGGQPATGLGTLQLTGHGD